jgi:YgiT-type zinc finger domain-containing protein
MAFFNKRLNMKCRIQGCPGEYENKLILHTVKRGSEVLVFEDVPAEVCNICSDMLLAPETVRHLERLIRQKSKPGRYAPVYLYV